MQWSLVAIVSLLTSLFSPLSIHAQPAWPAASQEAKAGARWWWLGSAVDKKNIQWNMQEYAKAGIGSLEITPIYGVQGNKQNELSFLSTPWMEALKFSEQEGQKNGIAIDMSTGTGWPFGGPNVPLEEAACKAVFVDTTLTGRKFKNIDLSAPAKEQKYARLHKVMAFPITPLSSWTANEGIDVTAFMKVNKLTWKAPKLKIKADVNWRFIALYISRTRQQVKRAAPGGQGYVIDHFDRLAVKHYLERFDSAFAASGTPYPHNFFNDSYEVYGADWTPTLLDEFAKRRGYQLEKRLNFLLDGESRTLSDYRETLGEMLLENFTQQWTAWAHSHGVKTRNQAHGSPANLIDVYAAVNIPEIEGFGLSEFGIKGLRKDPGFTKKNDSDVSMLKYAASAAHITGKPLVSSETFTWLTEHFRTSLSQMKPDMDLMFTCGVNHMFFHGTCYSPKDDPWPGWKFYASVDMSPTNSIWRDAPYFLKYIERCQSFLQMGKPDNDFLVYLPVRDMWQQKGKSLLMQFDIHSMDQKAPEFIKSILEIDKQGYDCDYISDKYLLTTTYKNGMLETAAGTRYSGLIIPGSGRMPQALKEHLEALKAQGAHIIYGINDTEMKKAAKPEIMRTKLGLRAIRRSNATGHHYFIANLTPNDVDEMIALTVDFNDAALFNPMTGEIHQASVDGNKVRISLRSGESVILQTYKKTANWKELKPSAPITPHEAPITLGNKWTLTFVEEAPKVEQTFQLDKVQTWETLDNDAAKVTMGTGVYTTTVTLTKAQAKKQWTIDLGDVRESARVYINGTFIGCAWAVPYVLDTKNTLKAGNNEIRIEVTNLPANRIADLDRKGVKWRKFNEINIVDLNYKKTGYENWTPVKSGLNSEVKLVEK
ncbi:MAG: glycosyl hydrolase family 2 [Prevotella sp.]|nr:glycosyl hydrolase family 2 [Prevotella sp.]